VQKDLGGNYCCPFSFPYLETEVSISHRQESGVIVGNMVILSWKQELTVCDRIMWVEGEVWHWIYWFLEQILHILDTSLPIYGVACIATIAYYDGCVVNNLILGFVSAFFSVASGWLGTESDTCVVNLFSNVIVISEYLTAGSSLLKKMLMDCVDKRVLQQ